jgi:predicted amidophosphoribosyltransferase
MNFTKNISWFGLRGCLYCGSLFRYSDGLCNICSEDLWSWQNPDGTLYHQRIRELDVFSLFQWVPGRQEVLSRLIHALKGKNGDALWSTYAEEFDRRRTPDRIINPQKPLLIIPSPAKNKTNDHAMLFAIALGKEQGGELYCCLLRENSANQQKKKSRS